MPSKLCVLSSPYLLGIVLSFQHGFPCDIVRVRQLLRHAKLSGSLDDVINSYAPFHDVFPAWYQWRGTRGITMLLQDLCMNYLTTYALVYENLELLQCIHTLFPAETIFWDCSFASITCNLKLLKFLYSHGHRVDESAMNRAVIGGRLDIVQFLHENGVPTYNVLTLACIYGHIDIVLYAMDEKIGVWKFTTVDAVVEQGHLHILKLLHEYDCPGFTSTTMDVAARCGYFDIVVFLHEYRTEGCTDRALSYAARMGHLKMVKYIDRYCFRGSITRAVKLAQAAGHDHIAKYLLYKGFNAKKCCSSQDRITDINHSR